MPIELLVWLVAGFLAVVVLHELTHVIIARAHGHPTVCFAVNPLGVAVVFEDTPSRRYWTWQVLLPMAVTAVVSYVWLYLLATYPSELQVGMSARGVVETLPWVTALLAVLTSGGDILGMLVEVRRPVLGDERILRDFRVLRRIPSHVRFTAYGQQRWEAIYRQESSLQTEPVTIAVAAE